MTRLKRNSFYMILALIVTVLVSENVLSQEFVVKSRVTTTGQMRAVGDDQITVLDSAENIAVYKVLRKGAKAVSIDGKFLRSPAQKKVTGQLAAAPLLQPGMVIKFNASLKKGGRSKGEIKELTLTTADTGGTVKEVSSPEDSGFAQCEVIGAVQQLKKNRLTLLVGESPYASKNRVRVDLDKNAVVKIEADDLNLVQAGDKIIELKAFKLASGHLVVKSLDIELQGERNRSVLEAMRMESQYSRLSDEPAGVREVRSQHFLLYTDVSDRQGQMLLDKLETMIKLVSQYYRRPSKGLIECYVVRDLSNFPPETFPDGAVAKIREPAGVTITRSLGKQRRTIVFSCDQHQTVQHEAVHAYCQQTFGSTGPVWYSEGMAEMGAYWKEGQLEVDIQPGVIHYLTNAKPKTMADIVAAGQVTGDSWQAYAWRWALCHLLANNKNYSNRLKGLGMAMMSGKKASFEATYGDVAQHISFEYDQFVKNFGNGYRADLAAWQWDVKPKRLSGKKAKRTVLAARGWQATGVLVVKGQSYDVQTEGTWQIAEAGEALTGGGDGRGKGKLVGAIFNDFRLSEPFELGAQAKFEASQDGHLVVRCQDAWTELSENSGELKITVGKTETP